MKFKNGDILSFHDNESTRLDLEVRIVGDKCQLLYYKTFIFFEDIYSNVLNSIERGHWFTFYHDLENSYKFMEVIEDGISIE